MAKLIKLIDCVGLLAVPKPQNHIVLVENHTAVVVVVVGICFTRAGARPKRREGFRTESETLRNRCGM